MSRRSSTRPYTSRLREDQAQRTRELILDALTELLATHAADEISTRAIAERAGVSQPTVYRHFPDRPALLEGLSDRIDGLAAANERRTMPEALDDIPRHAEQDFVILEEYAAAATAQAILNADPRRLARSSRERTEALRQLVARELPEYDERDHLRITALLRSLYSVQTWLRLREEFGITGSEPGPILAWAFDTLIREIRAGNFPRAEPSP
jgi:AcrR family transcriptional regulator